MIQQVVKPRPRQLAFQSWEFGVFLHFGIRTFYQDRVDWDGKELDPVRFNPTELDCEQWVRTAKQTGARYMVLTAKHHDGFNLWPSACSDFTVAASPWRGGKGDVVAEFTDACRRHDMKVGLYYSPAEWNCPFFDDEEAYDDYFVAQLRELLSNYGTIDVLWFDGCGSEGHTYDWPRIAGEIRSLQPEVCIFNMADADYRWIGNEAGVAPVPCWNVVDGVPFSVLTAETEAVGGPAWLPAECDCCIRHGAWFHRDEENDAVRDVEELMGLYYWSVGRGCNLLLNIGPDTRGLLPDLDAARLLQMGAEVERRFGTPLAGDKEFPNADGNYVISFESPTLVDHAIVQEDLADGERVRRFAVGVLPRKAGRPVAAHQGFNIGHKAIVRFPAIKAGSVHLQILESDGPAQIARFDVFHTGG